MSYVGVASVVCRCKSPYSSQKPLSIMAFDKFNKAADNKEKISAHMDRKLPSGVDNTQFSKASLIVMASSMHAIEATKLYKARHYPTCSCGV